MKILDTRELEERRVELTSAREDYVNEVTPDASDDPALSEIRGKEWDGTDEGVELAELESLSEEISEWRNGEQLIPESDFEDYARELADDLGAVSSDASWPLTCIDWAQAAHELQMDYSSCEYQGETYLYRS